MRFVIEGFWEDEKEWESFTYAETEDEAYRLFEDHLKSHSDTTFRLVDRDRDWVMVESNLSDGIRREDFPRTWRESK